MGSKEDFAPNCFGISASVPSIRAHTGIKGYSTKKLTRHAATTAPGPGSPHETVRGIPFNVAHERG
jgi:alpha-mannosidase